MLSKADKKTILEAFKSVDVKQLEIDHPNKDGVNWFRFGSFVGLDIATKIIQDLPERKTKKTVDIP